MPQAQIFAVIHRRDRVERSWSGTMIYMGEYKNPFSGDYLPICTNLQSISRAYSLNPRRRGNESHAWFDYILASTV
jgi:hypothetical protein